MKLRIGDTDYDYLDSKENVKIQILMDLQTQGGPSRRRIDLALNLINDALGDDEADVMDDPTVLAGIAGLIFLCKRNAGEPLTWEQAKQFSWPKEAHFVLEPSDFPDEPPDPPVPSGEVSQPDGETSSGQPSKGKTSRAGKSTTSKRRSADTSS